MHRIKIVHIIGSLRRAGAERFVVDLCNELAENQQYEIYLVSLRDNSNEANFLTEISGKVKYLSFHKKRGLSLKVLLKLTSWLVKQNATVVHTHLNALEYLLLYRIRSRNCRFFHTIHSIAEAECPNFVMKSIREMLYKSNKVTPIVVSYDGSNSFRKYYGLNNVTVIENGRPFLNLTDQAPSLTRKYKRDENSFLLIHIGRIIKVKNQSLLIQAVQKFNAIEQKKCRLLIIGDVREDALYQDLFALAGKDKSVEFLGGRDNVADYLSMADFFCLSSFYEGMPISLIEALSVGCIPICTRVGGIKDMIEDGKNGFLSADSTVDSYYQAIKKAVFFQDKQKIKENGFNSFKRNYHIGASGKKHLEAYNLA